MSMTKKITLEFDGKMLSEQKRVPIKGKGRKGIYRTKTVPINNPKAWTVITVENSSTFNPGQTLNKKQVQTLCRGAGFNVVIGGPGQYSKSFDNRY